MSKETVPMLGHTYMTQKWSGPGGPEEHWTHVLLHISFSFFT